MIIGLLVRNGYENKVFCIYFDVSHIVIVLIIHVSVYAIYLSHSWLICAFLEFMS